MPDDDIGIRHEFLDLCRDGLDVVNAIVDEKHLPLAGEFAIDRLLDAFRVVGYDLRHNRPTLKGRGCQ